MNAEIVPSRKPVDPTAYELYKAEHPDRGIGSYILLNVALIGSVLGTVYWLQHLTTLVMVLGFVACLVAAWRFK